MIAAPLAAKEPERLAALLAYGILDSNPDPAVDAITRTAARVLNVPIALVSLVDEHRQWFMSTVGCFSPGDETSRDIAFCAHALLDPQQPLVVQDAREDIRFCDNPLVTDYPGLRFYAGMPLLDRCGLPLGTLCIADTVPRGISPDELAMLRDLASAVGSALEVHRATAELRETNEHYRAATALNPHFQWSTGADGGNLETSPNMAAVMGITQKQWLGDCWQQLLHPDDAQTVRQRWGKSVRTGERYNIEYRMRVADGTYHWFRAYAAPRYDAKGRIVRWHGMSEDIQDRKLIEVALRESEEHHRFAMETSPQIPWTARSRGQIEEISPRLSELTGLSQEAILVNGWAQFTHPEDQTKVRRGWLRSAKSGDPFDIEYRIRVADGSYRWFHVRAFARRDASGEILRWYGTLEDVTKRREDQARIVHMAHHDSLTGLANRILYRERMQQALACVAKGERLALLCVDLDNFKAVNDARGHTKGDMLLRQVAERLSACTRKTDIVCRFGGDEFVIAQMGMDQPQRAAALAARLIKAVSEPYDLDGQPVTIGATVGVAVAPDDGTCADKLFQRADAALWRGKADGRGSVRFFDPQLDVLLEETQTLRLDLRHALVRKELEVFYQPIVDTRSGRVACFEALLRWRHPSRGLVSPELFIPLAEETGLIRPIGEYVLAQACRDAKRWPSYVKVAVNLSPVQFADVGLVGRVANTLHASGLAPGRLDLEITESVLLAGSEADLAMLRSLRELGIGIALDDFGAGYSSLSYLQDLKFDKLKLDKSLVRKLTLAEESRVIVRMVVALGRELGLSTVAEGVETSEQLELLRGYGCDQIQGFIYSRPVQVSEVAALLQKDEELSQTMN